MYIRPEGMVGFSGNHKQTSPVGGGGGRVMIKNRYNKEYRIYHLKELSLDKMIEMYHDYASSHGFARHQERKIYEGIEMLIHFIATKQISRYDSDKDEIGVAEINYDVADKVIGDVYQDANTFLREMDIIRCVGNYVVGEKAYSYIINPKYTITPYYTVQAYPEKFYVRLTRAIKDYERKLLETLSPQERAFREAYNENLAKVIVTDKDGLKRYVDEYDYTYQEDVKDKKTRKITHRKGELNVNKQLFYKQAYHAYIEGDYKVYKWDDYGRIHHFLTNSPKGFRDFLNIYFVRDIHNCQPLLFATMLYEYYNVTKATQEYLSIPYNNYHTYEDNRYKELITYTYNEGGFAYHYETRNLYNSLFNSELDKIKGEIALLPIDVLEYLYLVMSGKLWDILSELFHMERGEVKSTMFAELFYSNEYEVKAWQKHGKVFELRFPNVTKAIISIRKKHPRSWLPQEMQRRESKIMHKVLQELIKHEYDVISIHDEIIILDTDNNQALSLVDDDGISMDNIQGDVEYLLQDAYIEEGMGCALGN